tara:strand:+ start:7941 stop:9086 length:1146 start_codon:yes stop_codon:yes gene_type:complete
MDAITEHHYHNIANGKAKNLDDGNLATVNTIIVNIGGVETLIPTVWDGEIVSTEKAIEFAGKSGISWPTRSGENAVAELEAFDQQIHLEMTDQTTPEEASRILAEKDMPEMALGGLAVARKGITTPEGLEMANKTTQLDRKKADRNNDGILSKYEEVAGEAVQMAMADDPDQDEKVMMGHGGMAMMSDNVGMMSDPLPIGTTETEVADDIEAMISENEYVLPANVVKWHGLKYIMSMQEEAEMGLMMMQGSGLIQEAGGSEEDEYEDHMMYSPETGEGKMTKSYEEHLDLKTKGWGHESETQEKSDSTGAENAKVSDASDPEQEEQETIETPKGNEIEVARVETVIEEQDDNETEDYKINDYGSNSHMFGTMKKPKYTFVV